MLREILSIIVCLALIDSSSCDYYSSVSGLEKLLEVEKDYLKSLEEHTQKVAKLHRVFESFLDHIEQEKIQDHAKHFYEEPINAFRTLRRIVVDWKYADDLAQQIEDLKVFNKSASLSNGRLTPPSIEDLRGAASGLSRLQQIYQLDATSIAKGYLKGQQYSTPMTAVNCFTVGQSLYESREFQYASEWLIEALHKVEDEDQIEYEGNVKGNELLLNENNLEDAEIEDDDEDEEGLFPYVTSAEILEFLVAALYNVGNRNLAISMNSKLLAIDPENPYGLANEDAFKSGLKEERRKRIVAPPPEVLKIPQLYEQVCSGELQQTPGEKRHLHCRYVTNNVAYYRVGPLKLEELNTDPFVALYHEAIHDSEIDGIINSSQASIERSMVGYVNDHDAADFRISKNSWLDFEEHDFMAKIAQRLEDITGLSRATGEEMQVANYGIGGFYGTHFDFSDIPDDDYPGEGNRILTAMFYVNDVELGGATAFPILRLAVPPIKGSLLVWYNLHKSLEPDYRTSHAGCPVLKGSKWICNEWFHAVGQEFLRPCDLKADGEISKPYEDWNLG